jgi:hypothetical protein
MSAFPEQVLEKILRTTGGAAEALKVLDVREISADGTGWPTPHWTSNANNRMILIGQPPDRRR